MTLRRRAEMSAYISGRRLRYFSSTCLNLTIITDSVASGCKTAKKFLSIKLVALRPERWCTYLCYVYVDIRQCFPTI